MTDYALVVYATHAQGMFQALIDDANAYNVPITLLGWGEPWVAFRQKFEAMHTTPRWLGTHKER